MPSTKSEPRLSPKSSILEFEAIGTHWKIELASLPKARLDLLTARIAARIEEFDKTYSRFRKDSLITRISRDAGEYRLPVDARPMMDLYYKLNKLSNGLVTPLIGDVLVAAGYDADYSLRAGEPVSPLSWDEVIIYDHPLLRVKHPVVLDFGAAGKGYLVDIVAKILEDEGIDFFVINAGGDIVARGDQATQVALEHPEHPSLAIGVANLHNRSLCGSAGNRRQWDKYHHVINPKKLVSPNHLKAVWVMAGDGLTADGLATALYFVEPEKLAKHFDFAYAIVNDDLSLQYSPNFNAEFF